MTGNLAITGVILAGGKSSRMGTDKGLMGINMVPMVCFAIDALSKVIPRIVISTNNPDYGKFGLPLIPDHIKDIGPMGGLHAALSEVQTPHILILSADMPLIIPRILQTITDLLKPDSVSIISRHNNKIEPLCGIYSKSILSQINDQIESGDYSLHHLLELLNTEYVDFTTDTAGRDPFMNINTPGQIEELND